MTPRKAASASPQLLRKCDPEDEYAASLTTKKPKIDIDSKEVTKAAQALLQLIPRIEKEVEQQYSKIMRQCSKVLKCWQKACATAKDAESLTSELGKWLEKRLPLWDFLDDISPGYNRQFEGFGEKLKAYFGKSQDEDLREEAVQEAERVRISIPEITEEIELACQVVKDECLAQTSGWRVTCEMLHPDANTCAARLPVDVDTFRLYNAKYESFVHLLSEQRYNLPSPSTYGVDWPVGQGTDARIYCLRPTNVRSLPLCILHDVFRQFRLNIEQPLPVALYTAITARQIATRLCAIMGDSFSQDDESILAEKLKDYREEARTAAFEECIGNFFGILKREQPLRPKHEAHSGKADSAILVGKVIVTLFEMKAETGTKGDAYMQIARCYDLAVKLLLQDSANAFVQRGAPMFLVCIVGPMIMISGGFYDGKNVIVEPLTQPYHMLQDPIGVRQEKVAQALYALRKGIDELESHVSPSFIPFSNQ